MLPGDIPVMEQDDRTGYEQGDKIQDWLCNIIALDEKRKRHGKCGSSKSGDCLNDVAQKDNQNE